MPQSSALTVEVVHSVDPTGRDPAELTAFITATEDRWGATGHFQIEDGHLVCRRLDIGGKQLPTPGITSAFLREIPMGAILTAVRSELAQQAGLWEQASTAAGPHTDFGKSAKVVAQSLRPGDLKRGRRGYPDDHYRRIAFAYLALQDQEWSRGLLGELARQENRPRETIRDWVHRAGELGFLAGATPGRAGRLPGPRLYEQLS